MALPFDFFGTLKVPGVRLEAIAGQIEIAIISQGGRITHLSEQLVEFRGVVNYLSLSPLTNIAHGEIEFRAYPSGVNLAYTVHVDRAPFVAAVLCILAGLGCWAVGLTEFAFFAIFGLMILSVAIVASVVIRRRFPRWLRKICNTSSSSMN